MVTYDVFAVLMMGLIVLYFQRAGGALMTYRGIRVITCPGTGQPAAVQLATWRRAIQPLLGKAALRVHKCSEWPDRRDCNQGCVRQIAAAPAASLVPNILARWYQDRTCVCCGTPLRKIHTGHRQPGLMIPERKMIEWEELPPQKIPQVLASASPVCRTCLVAEKHTW